MEVGLGLAEFVVAAVLRAGAGVWGHGAVDRCRTVAAHGQVQQTGAGGQVDVLDVFHLRATHWTRLQRHSHSSALQIQINKIMNSSSNQKQDTNRKDAQSLEENTIVCSYRKIINSVL